MSSPSPTQRSAVTAPGRSNEPRMPPIRASADGGGNTDPAGPMTRAAAPAARRPRPSPACFFFSLFQTFTASGALRPADGREARRRNNAARKTDGRASQSDRRDPVTQRSSAGVGSAGGRRRSRAPGRPGRPVATVTGRRGIGAKGPKRWVVWTRSSAGLGDSPGERARRGENRLFKKDGWLGSRPQRQNRRCEVPGVDGWWRSPARARLLPRDKRGSGRAVRARPSDS
jgi:hypothetical protein